MVRIQMGKSCGISCGRNVAQLGANVNPPNYSDLTYDFASRSSLALVDSIAADNAEIVGSEVAVFNGTSKISQNFTIPNKQLITNLIIVKNTVNDSPYVFAMPKLVDGLNGFDIRLTGTDIEFHVLVGASLSTLKYTGQAPLNSWLYIIVEYDGATQKITTPSGSVQKSQTGDIATSNNQLTIGNFGVFNKPLTGNVLFAGSVNRILTSTEKTNFFNNIIPLNLNVSYHLNGHTYDSITGLEATNNGVTFALDTEASPLTALTNGYVEKATGEQIINPTLNTTNVAVYDKMHLGGKMHNLISSFVRFPVADIFDRSNTTIHSAASRASIYYDSGDPTLYHVSELDYDTLVNYFEAAYIDRIFTGIKASYTVQDFIFRILAYATQKTGADLTSVKNYIKYS